MAAGKLGLALTARELTALVADDLKQVESVFRLESIGSVEAVSSIASYLQGNGGKRLRPILLLVSCRLFREPTAEAIQLAAVVELIHTATLVHDDVIDEAVTRRGVESVNARWGNLRAILAGDFLLAGRLAEDGAADLQLDHQPFHAVPARVAVQAVAVG